jgi:hypothetical protein
MIQAQRAIASDGPLEMPYDLKVTVLPRTIVDNSWEGAGHFVAPFKKIANCLP